MAENYIDLKFITDTTPLERAEKVADRLERRINKLVSEEAKGRITTQQYSAEVRKLATEMQKAAGGTIQARNAVLQYSRDAYQAAESMRQMAAAAQMSQKAMHQKGVVTQQVGYQVGDLLVQVQSGTNFFVAFGQQATQLVGVLGMLNPKLIGLSAALGIAIPLVTALAAMMSRSSEATKDAEKDLRSYSKAAQTASEKIAQLRLEEEARVANQRDTTAFLLKQGVKQAELELKLAQETMNTSMEETGVLQAQINAATQTLKIRKELLENYNKELDIAEQRKQQEKRIEEAQDRAKERLDAYINSMADLFRSVQAGYQAVAQAQTTVNSDTEAYIASMAEVFKTSQDLRKELGDAAFEALRLSGVDITSGVSEAAKAAAILAANLGVSLSAAQSIMNLQASKEYSGRGGDPRKVGTSDYTSELGYKTVDQLIAEFNKRNRSGGGGKSEADQLDEYMKKQQALAELQLRQIGMTEEQARVEELKTRYIEANIPVEMARIEKLAATEEALRKATEAEARRQSLMDSISGHIENAFMAMVDGSMSVEDAFKAMLRNIILDIYRQQVVKPFVSAIMGLFANGGAFIGGNQVKAFADGGVVGSPTYFPMSGGRTGLMGEAGPEAIMPLKRGSNGKLGVQMNGGGQVVVNQSINISTGVQQTVRNEIKSMMPQIAEQSKAAVLDAKRRGGSYGGKF